jgi:hypothetical protein
MDWDRDCNKALIFIKNHALRDKIVSMYTTGPPKDQGFMWWKNESEEYKAMDNFVSALGYDSSAYGCMQRKIQKAICDMYNHRSREETVPTVPAAKPYVHPVIGQIKAVFHRHMVTGHMPKDPEEIMKLLGGIPVSLKELYKLAETNKLEWIYAMGMDQSREDYQRAMNKAMAHYLKEAAEGMDSPNRKAAEVWQERGHEAAGAYMMEQAGGDYATMRSMFG